MNIPNLLTIFRISLVPIFVIFVIHNDLWMALVIFILAGITDGLDGFIARLLNQRTVVGAYLDPIADKMLLMSAYIGLAFKDMLPGWLSVIVVSRDVIILAGIAIISLMGKGTEIRPSIASKFTTVFQILTIIIILYPFPIFYIRFFIPITAALTILSGIQYMYRGIKIMGDIT